MKKLSIVLILASTCGLFSCDQHSGTNKKGNDSAYTGLEGTREEASQLSGSTIDTSSGQTVKKESKDSSHVKKDSLPVK